jgi:hypothetical protein
VINKPMFAALAVILTAPLAAAQAPPRPQPQTPPQASVSVKPTTTLTGCLYREDQVPGRTPNVAERAGVLEDYILADTTVVETPPQAKPPAGTPAGTTGTAVPATGNMYKVENISDDRLKDLVGKRVEVQGRIDPEGRNPLGVGGGPRPDRGPGPDAISLPEIEASSIREVSGKCPSTPPLGK